MIVRIRPFLDPDRISKALAAAPEPDGVKKFEAAFAAGFAAAGAVAFDRGRSALLAALKILGVKKGDEVVVQSYIFRVVIDAILEAGARPVLADSSLEDFNVAPRAIGQALTSRTRAVIVTHLGIPCDMEEISGIIRRHGCYLIENCAHVLGAECGGKKTGAFGDLSFYSFDTDKPVSTGDGGMLIINNEGLLENARGVLGGYGRVPIEKEREIVCGLLLQHFVTGEEIYPADGFLPVDFGKEAVKKDRRLLDLVERAAGDGPGADGFTGDILPYLRRSGWLNEKGSPLKDMVSRAGRRVRGRARVVTGRTDLPKIDSAFPLMNSLRAAVGTGCLADYGRYKAVRDRNAQYYADHLDSSAFKKPVIAGGKKPAFIRYAVLNNTGYGNSFITAAARRQGFEAGIFNWSAPVHLCYPYNGLLAFDRSRLQNSEHLGKRLLSLPVHPYVGVDALEKIVSFLNGLAG
ncbi:MAG: DegT/DnrJ/EryC1/StrS family aminotransferase [Nitrospiraceae bacterium]|nr:DegT/DnrJ/EryC1/StrS family aminotransferase [Nitrospiraceae bacterium]